MSLKSQLREVLSYSQSIEDPQIDELYSKWEEKREHFRSLFPTLTLQSKEEITVELDTPLKKQLFREFSDSCPTSLANFLTDFISVEEFFSNSITNPSTPFHGTKLLKAFKHFISDSTTLRFYQDKASQIIQQNKIHGFLCLSIHPLDYLSLSNNASNWRSCHSLDGDYRAGNLSYLADKATIIAYLKSSKDTSIPGFPFIWNDKKWRCLLFLNPEQNILFAGRQYPFNSPQLLSFIKEQFFPSFTPWDNTYQTTFTHSYNTNNLNNKYFEVAGNLYTLEDFIHQPSNPLHFNDLLESSYYTDPYYSYKPFSYSYSPLYIGDDVKCINCGSRLIDTDKMLCEECEDAISSSYYYCDCCDRTIYPDEYFHTTGLGEVICEECFNSSRITQCPNCKEYFFEEDILNDLCPNCRK